VRPSNVEDLIAKLDPEISKIYFEAKAVVINTKDSKSEHFSAAARIVRAFWGLTARPRGSIR
jgi:hypothetical protein